MTETLIQPTRFSVPAITPRPGELLDVATIVGSGLSWLPREGLFESFNCINTGYTATMPCPVVTIAAPVQAASGTATTGGSLVPGTYRAVITALNARGETVKSNEISQVVPAGTNTNTVTFNWGAVSGATGYRVYVTNGAAGTQALYVDDSASPYVLTAYPPAGAVSAAPPTTNTAVISVTKTFDTPGWQDGIMFAAYAGHTCKGIAYDGETLADLQKVFEANESIAVERALMQQRFTVNGSVWPAATDLTPAGGAVSAKAGLAMLEGHASWKYAGVPTLHVPRSVASLLTQNGSIKRDGNTLETVLGSKVAAGGGYEEPNTGPTGAAPAAGEKWMYASGEVVVARSEIVAKNEMDRSTNEILSLVERMYVAAVDCYTSAIRVKVE